MVGVLAFSWCPDRPSVPPACLPLLFFFFLFFCCCCCCCSHSNADAAGSGFLSGITGGSCRFQDFSSSLWFHVVTNQVELSPDLPVHQSEAEAAKVSSFQFFIQKLDLIVSPGGTNRTVSSRISFYIRVTFISALKSKEADLT
ncbi:hypothetical protein CHARACLAT_026894 [Characodon lateralis]|uniref:Secreted protein n=1 Tax=Characodon lateralis TaxID=208331 RepID=A0ABU7DLX3_9TELE|nr:hypothetical protein [Characodon lateralis]